ncbi:MAG: hypothetical protein ILA25_06590 [Prevotella sp.]|nr:hypothetical protein [Prevotella sp.]
MKKSLLLVAAAVTALFSACSSDELANSNIADGDMVNVSFSANFDQAIATRSVSGDTDGSQATTLYVAVYNANNELIKAISKIGVEGSEATATVSGNTATVNFQLVKGQTYNFAFWAQNPNATALAFDAENKKVTVNYDKANDETLDAFTAHVNGLEVTGAVSKSVVLKRPWAQLNYGATQADVKAAHLAGIDVKKTKVTVNNVFKTLNLLDGTVADPQTADFELALNAIPNGQNQVAVDIDGTNTQNYGKLTVNSTDYAYMGLNYLLVGGENDTQSLIKADLSLYKENDDVTPVNTIAFSNVPVQRNYRTNIVGNLLTSQTQFNITLNPMYDDDNNPVFAEVKTGISKDGIGNYVVSTEVADKTTAINDILTDAKESGISKVKVTLPDGEYNATLYSGSSIGISSLTIAGNGDTQVKFNNLQVMTSLFDELVIENCEIERMPNKSWGMCVFGGSGKANGVYTVKNCKFTGVSTQGIYINETASGATYNIEGCTFDGDFGTEGAITIQNNANVNHIVNIKNCTFSNILNTSHKVYIIYDYTGWTLNTENNTGLDESDIYWKTNN